MDERYDIAIIGTGPAGISAAITASARNKRILLIGSCRASEKLWKAHLIRNYPGFPNISGQDLSSRFLDHLKVMDIMITDKRVAMVYAMGDYYSLQTDGDFLEASSVILATGVSFGKSFPGEDENLGRGVSYCATCDAALYRGKTVIVAGYTPKADSDVRFLSEMARKVIYIPVHKKNNSGSGFNSGSDNIDISGKTENNDDSSADDNKNNSEGNSDRSHVPGTGRVLESGNVEIILCRPISIKRRGREMVLVTDNCAGGNEGMEIIADGIFLLRESVRPSALVPGLEMDGNHVKVDRKMATNLSGLFAAGDVTGTPYQYIKSAGEGNIAALSAVSYVDGLKN